MSAFLLVAMVAGQGLFVPAEAWAVANYTSDRERVLWFSLKLGLVPTAVSPFVLAVPTVFAPADTPNASLLAFWLTATIAAILSPLQDHVRRVLHLSSRSHLASVVSTLQFLTVIVSMVLLHVHGPGLAWVPFGALAAANAISLTAGLLMALPSARVDRGRPMGSGDVFRGGRWLLLAALVERGSGFAAAALLTRLAGASFLGYAEAARVIGRPVFVLLAGFSAVLSPRSMEAGTHRRLGEARRVSQLFLILSATATLVGLAAFGGAFRWNPFYRLIPNAYVVSGLVAATIVANALSVFSAPWKAELIGANREASVAVVEGIGNALRLAVAGLAPWLRAFVIPVGLMLLGAVRWWGRLVARNRIYEPQAGGGPSPGVDRAAGRPSLGS
jgi:hypothetical protein